MTADGGRTEHPDEPAEGDRELGEEAEEQVRLRKEHGSEDDHAEHESGSA